MYVHPHKQRHRTRTALNLDGCGVAISYASSAGVAITAAAVANVTDADAGVLLLIAQLLLKHSGTVPKQTSRQENGGLETASIKCSKGLLEALQQTWCEPVPRVGLCECRVHPSNKWCRLLCDS